MATSAGILFHDLNKLPVKNYPPPAGDRLMLRVGDADASADFFGTLGELQQFGAKVTAAVRSAVEAQQLAVA
jgi:hypothetical protein